jgi:hypothetical protein
MLDESTLSVAVLSAAITDLLAHPEILTQLGVAEQTKKTPLKELQQWGHLKAGTPIKKTENLFPRLANN